MADVNKTPGLLKRLVKRPPNGADPIVIEICRMGPGWEHMKEQVVNYHMKHFVPRETINKYLGLMDDAVSLTEMREFWSEIYDQGISIAALLWGNNGPEVIGANMLSISSKEEKFDMSKAEGIIFKKIGDVIDYFHHTWNIYEDFKVDKYLSPVGLSIHEEYGGMGLGEEIILQRVPLCKELGITLDVTLYTGPGSQHLGRKTGYQTISEIPYDSFEIKGNKIFPGKPGVLLYTYKKMSPVG